MLIASAVGKPLAIDKATQDRSRPSAVRVKVLLDLLDKHPKKVKIHIVDKVSGKYVEFHQQVVYDNLPKYCTCCKHQGHDESSCRSMQGRNRKVNEKNTVQVDMTGVELSNVEQLKGDSRELLNAKRAANKIQETTNIEDLALVPVDEQKDGAAPNAASPTLHISNLDLDKMVKDAQPAMVVNTITGKQAHSSNTPTLHFSSPHVEKIIKDA
nr:uncharacterized protein LOC108944429 [Nicotiana tomentosiformis]